MKTTGIDDLLEAVRRRHDELISSDYNSKIIESFRAHLSSLAKWYDEPNDYPEVDSVAFPNSIHIACAVCHPECGTVEWIVDGSTQRCQRCGASMFRTEVAEYGRRDPE